MAPTVLVLRNESEARLLEAILVERGIPHFLKSYHDSAYDGIWQSQFGWGHVEAPDEYRERILGIYADLTASDENAPGGEGENEADRRP